jgi:hypothetical protein
MNRVRSAVAAGTLAFALAGCADGVLFVTKTSLSILEADTKPAGISIAYDRVEGYLGPTSEGGEPPPVLGYFGSDGEIFKPKVQQVYATGNAARLLFEKPEKCAPDAIENTDRVMFFGTSTSAGLKVGFFPNAPIPDSFVFGWRRKEFSLIPLSVAAADKDCGSGNTIKKGQRFYPATLASVNSARAVTLSGPETTTLRDQQYFATGDAAKALAERDEVRGQIRTLSEGVFGDYYARDRALKEEGVVLAACYAGLRVADRPKVWDEASRFRLFQDSPGEDTGAALKNALKQSVDAQGNVTNSDLLARADRAYMKTVVEAPGGSDAARPRLLEIHRKTVCDLADLNK